MELKGLILSDGERPFRKNILYCNKAYDEISVPNSKVAEYSHLGYEISRPGKARTRMTKQKQKKKASERWMRTLKWRA